MDDLGNEPESKTEVHIVGEDGESSKLPAVSKQVMYSLFNDVTGSKEYHTTQLIGSKIISKPDIQQLCYELAKFLVPYDPGAYSLRFIITHKSGKRQITNRKNLPSLADFESYGESVTEPVSDLEVYLKFLLEDKQLGRPNAYELFLDFTGFVYRKEQANAFIGLDKDSGPFPPPVYMRVEYVDFSVARSIMKVVEDWFHALPDYNLPRQPKWLPNLVEGFGFSRIGRAAPMKRIMFRWIPLACVLALLFVLSDIFIALPSDLHLNARNVLMGFVVYYFYLIGMDWLYVRAVNNSWPRGDFLILDLNEGSNRMVSEHRSVIDKKINSGRITIYTVFIGAVGSLLASIVLYFGAALFGGTGL